MYGKRGLNKAKKTNIKLNQNSRARNAEYWFLKL